jgi:cell division protein FtsQ
MTGLITRAASAGTDPNRRRPRPVLVIVAAALVILLAVWIVAFSPVLAVRSVAVKGALQRLTVERIRTAAQVPSGTPLLRLDTTPVRKRVEALPEVASARVSVAYPSTVTITVTERVAVGYLNVGTGAGSDYALVDKTGRQFVRTTTLPADLPHFELAPGADPQSSTMASAQVAAALPKDILARLTSISAGASTAVSLVLRDGRVVRWGSAQRNEEKAQLLVALLKQPGNTFDISNPDSVVVS